MRIVGAALVNRFYACDGWTREKVAALLNVQDVKYVTPRYWKEKESGVPYIREEPVAYYAVYDIDLDFPHDVGFVREAIEKHEYKPFICDFMNGNVWDCDKEFFQKNRMAPNRKEKKDEGNKETSSK